MVEQKDTKVCFTQSFGDSNDQSDNKKMSINNHVLISFIATVFDGGFTCFFLLSSQELFFLGWDFWIWELVQTLICLEVLQ